jgi:Hpt domain
METQMSDPAFNRPEAGGDGEMIQVPNTLRLKVGSRFGALNPGAVAKAEAALKSLSSQFSQWLQDELSKLEAALAAVHAEGMNAETGAKLYTHAHDLKGLGTTYEYPIVTRIAGSLCKLIEDPAKRLSAPMQLVDAHVTAIRASVRDEIKDASHPVGKVICEELERQVAAVSN